MGRLGHHGAMGMAGWGAACAVRGGSTLSGYGFQDAQLSAADGASAEVTWWRSGARAQVVAWSKRLLSASASQIDDVRAGLFLPAAAAAGAIESHLT